MTKKQYVELTEILEELELDHGYAPSFDIQISMEIYECRELIFSDFEKYKIELITSERLVESKNDIIGRLNAI